MTSSAEDAAAQRIQATWRGARARRGGGALEQLARKAADEAQAARRARLARIAARKAVRQGGLLRAGREEIRHAGSRGQRGGA